MQQIDWQMRFKQQARWTQDLRTYLYPRVGLQQATHVLDVGCGTGALLGELQSQADAHVFGVDIQRQMLELAKMNAGVLLSQADAHQLPHPNDAFDITLCHFTLMWVSNPQVALAEMVRVTKPGSPILALAEPDYGGRIDYPPALEQIGKWQIESLQNQGADPFMGRKLSTLFNEAGLQKVESGVLGAQWRGMASEIDFELEWNVLESDLKHKPGFSEKLSLLKTIDEAAYKNGQRVLYVPTFYALGWK